MDNSKRISMAYGIFHGLRMLPGAINVIFLLSTGITLGEIAILQFIFSLSVFLFEIPTGVISDYISRKISVLIGMFLFVLYYLCLTKSPNLYYLYPGQLIFAIGTCLLSGAFEGWLLFTVKCEYPNSMNMVDHYNQLRGEINFWVTMCAGPLGSLIVYFSLENYRIVYYICIVFILIILMIIRKIPEVNYKKKGKIIFTKYINKILKDVKELFKRKEIALFFLVQGCFVITYQVVFFYWQPYFGKIVEMNKEIPKIFQVKEILLGVVFFCYSLGRALIVNFSRKKFKDSNPFNVSFLCVGVASIAMLLFSYSFNIWNIYIYILLFSIIQGTIALSSILLESQFIKKIPEDIVSSMLSFSSSISRVFAMGTLLILSKYLKPENLQLFFKGTIIIYIGIIACIFYLKKED